MSGRGRDRPAVRVHVARRGNAFMRDIASWLVEAAQQCGWDAALELDALPTVDGDLHLAVAPHELFPLPGAHDDELRRAIAASVLVGTEQPGTPWFDITTRIARRAAAVLDINRLAVEALRDRGIAASHLQLGAVPSMTAPAASTATTGRGLDVLFLGALDERRGSLLAGLAGPLADRRAELRLFRFEGPVSDGTPGLVFGRDKYALLADARVLLNLHRGGPTGPVYFEWARMVEAMANRCVVVTEPSADTAPLSPDVHFVEAEAEAVGEAIAAMLDDDRARERMADAAFAAVTEQLALAGTLGPVLDRLRRDVLPAIETARRPRGPQRRLFDRPHVPRLGFSAFRPHVELQRAAKRAVLAEDRLVRRVDGVRSVLTHGEHQHLERWTTGSWPAAVPEVSVVVPLYDQADLVVETLDSVAASEAVDFEIVVVEDHAKDTSRATVRAWMEVHDVVPTLLVAKSANEGLSHARNTGFAAARAPLVMAVDADNLVYPRCLRRLADALRADREASAAYSIIEDFGAMAALRSALDWDVERLCRGNYLDAQAMWRREAWERLGGYRPDEGDVYGWEDWDLWLRLAAAGGRATIVRQVLGRYRVQPTSMVALSNVAQDLAIAAIRSRYPTLPWPAGTAG